MTPSLDGWWQVLLTVVTSTHVPILGESRTSSISLALAHVEQGIQTQQLCDSWMKDKNPLATLTLPAAFTDAFPVESFPVQVVEAGGVVSYRARQARQAVGFDGSGPMPQRVGDAGVLDWEGDGKPGATVLVKVPFAGEGEVWVAQIGQTVLDGRVVDAGRVEGTVYTLGFAARTLGASNRMLDVNPEVHADDAASTFVMTRVAAGSTCATLPGRR